MLQLIRQIFKDPEDKTDIALLFANQVGLPFEEICGMNVQQQDKGNKLWQGIRSAVSSEIFENILMVLTEPCNLPLPGNLPNFLK